MRRLSVLIATLATFIIVPAVANADYTRPPLPDCQAPTFFDGSVCRTPIYGNLTISVDPTVTGSKMSMDVVCPSNFDLCKPANIVVHAVGTVRGLNKPLLAKRAGVEILMTGNMTAGEPHTVKLALSPAARKLFKDGRRNGKKVKGLKRIQTNVKINGVLFPIMVLRRGAVT